MKEKAIKLDRLSSKKIKLYITLSQLFTRIIYIMLPIVIYMKIAFFIIIIVILVIWDLYTIFMKDNYDGVLVRI